ncbi:hypothetical protein [Bogoriella caseilytica]|uniref:hypothetical protein n=1 Tax=Bogoriella caseilytica TaxID=56055 RepID=UPI000F484D4F|nr:hypothetical protein [Bogoriella caseilytica]
MTARRSQGARVTVLLTSSVLAAALLLTACSAEAPPAEAEPSPEPTGTPHVEPVAEESDEPEEDDTEEPEEPGLTIRDVDLAALEWREAVTEEYLTPVEGHEHRTLEVTDAVYADVDGDGHEDALAAIVISEQQWYEEIYYIWTWDPDEQVAVQVESPIARMARCGDTVLEIAAEEDAFVITEALRYQDGPQPDCASDGPVEITRQVRLEENWPVLTGELEGDGGICPQRLGTDDGWPVEDFDLHPGPWQSMTPLRDPAPAIFAEVDVWSHLWLYRENWMLVHVGYDTAPGEEKPGGDYTPCAWIFLEEDTRPIPHDPYLPEG